MSNAPGSHDSPSVGASPKADVGPDPVWGVALGVFGLLNMAIAGALTQHWWFNVGEAFLLVGAVVFLASVLVSNLKQQRVPGPGEMVGRVRALLRRRTSR